jgi:hypothetical protein
LSYRFRCETCDGFFNMSDLGAALDHEGPLQHRREDQEQ